MESSYVHFNTVGELIEALQKIPADTMVLTRNSNSMEQRGYSKGGCLNLELRKFKESRVNTCDAFDGTPYSYNCIDRVWNENESFDYEGLIID